MAKQTLDLGKRWYVLHTYSGYEENVKRNLEQRIDTFDMHDKISHVIVPKEKKIKIKNGKRTTIEEKIFPGYVLVEMVRGTLREIHQMLLDLLGQERHQHQLTKKKYNLL